MSSFTLESLYRIYDDDEGVYLEVGIDGDSIGLVEIRTTNKTGEDYFGKIRLALMPEQARLLADALNKCANSVEAEVSKR